MEDYKNNFARNIVYLRKQRGITQAQLAQSLSYTDTVSYTHLKAQIRSCADGFASADYDC